MSVKDRTETRAVRGFLILLCMLLPLQLLGSTGARATQSTPSSRFLDPACIRFNDPNAVVNGEIVYAEFTA
jgi:hypothetical protein